MTASIEELSRLSFDAEITDATLKELEESARAPGLGIARRIALTLLTRSKDQLLLTQHSDDDAAALLSMFDMLGSYAEHLESVLEFVHAARARVLVVAATVAQSGAEQ